MTATATKPRLQAHFEEQVLPKVKAEFGLTNRMEMPRVAKVVINCGIGKALDNQKLKPETRDTIIDTFVKISGQRPIMIVARKAVSNFKVREGAPSAFMVTLRRDRMWSFLDRLFNLATPRIKDFRGISEKGFDKGGCFSFGLTEQAVWPEINMAQVNFTHGMHINIVLERSNPKLSRFVLGELGLPFTRPEEKSKRA